MSGMYNKFFRAIKPRAIFGLTATPFRQDVYYDFPGGWKNYKGTRYQKMQIEAVTTTKMLTRYKEQFWDRLLCVISTQQLIDKDYLCELDYDLIDLVRHTDIPLNVSKSDFDIDAFEQLLSDKEQILITQLNEISNNHKNLLVFCSSIKQAKLLSGVKNGSDYVDSTMTKKQRTKAIYNFRTGKTKVMFNVGILTTGFDMPELEAIALIRPTRSLNLYNQMLGRLTRKADNKEVGVVYDFSGTVRTLGRLETIEVKKVEGKWDVTSETFPNGFHHKKLYSWRVNERNN
jgi:DNA repair protein RadD